MAAPCCCCTCSPESFAFDLRKVLHRLKRVFFLLTCMFKLKHIIWNFFQVYRTFFWCAWNLLVNKNKRGSNKNYNIHIGESLRKLSWVSVTVLTSPQCLYQALSQSIEKERGIWERKVEVSPRPSRPLFRSSPLTESQNFPTPPHPFVVPIAHSIFSLLCRGSSSCCDLLLIAHTSSKSQ